MKNLQRCLLSAAGLVLVLSQVSCTTAWKTRRYSGDGELKIEEKDYLFQSLFVQRGYTIQLKPIKLDRPTRLTYDLKKLDLSRV
jgi:hypothetical protein